jgi:hypothetical protein
MSRFTVTIESDRADAGTMTIHLDTSSGSPRVLEVTMAAAAGGSVSALSFSQLALDRLVSAFATEASQAPPVEASTRSTAAQPPGAPEADSKPGAAPPEPVAAKAPAKRAAKAPAKAAATKAAKARRPVREATPADGTARQYRRRPDTAELIGAYHEAASVTDLAAQYEVPRHTMNGWLARLRGEGLITPRNGAGTRS